jgi:DNA-binding transcriptional ArsR family regulator
MDESQRSAQHAAVFGALAHPVRHELFHLLCEGRRSPGELATMLDISKPNVSQHLAILRREGLASRVRLDGRVLWRVVDDRLGQACALIDEVLGRELQSRLYALERKEAPDVPRQ